MNCLSLAARGLWIEMLLLMHESPKRGYLTMTEQQLARCVGAGLPEIRRCLKELQSAQTYSVDATGAIFNRRMVRDEEISEVRSAAGKNGMAKRWQNDNKPDNKSKNLLHPYEGEVEVETEIEEIKETDVAEIFAMLDELYTGAGVPIPPKHKQYCVQVLVGIDPNKRMRVPRYVRHMLDSGRWSSSAKTKGLKNLLIDGDWDVEIVPRTIAAGASKPASVLSEMLAEERARNA